MSLYDYSMSVEVSAKEPSFSTLIMCAIRKADSDNLEKLKLCWPEIYNEFVQRYYAPGGKLPNEYTTSGQDWCGTIVGGKE